MTVRSGKNGIHTALVIIVVRTAHVVRMAHAPKLEYRLTWSLTIVLVVLACEERDSSHL
jgi:hypothetical protein